MGGGGCFYPGIGGAEVEGFTGVEAGDCCIAGISIVRLNFGGERESIDTYLTLAVSLHADRNVLFHH